MTNLWETMLEPGIKIQTAWRINKYHLQKYIFGKTAPSGVLNGQGVFVCLDGGGSQSVCLYSIAVSTGNTAGNGGSEDYKESKDAYVFLTHGWK